MQSSSPEQQAGRDKRTARRRLIRGAFGAPVALTVFSGSAVAGTVNCLANPPSTPLTQNIAPASDSDVFLRVQMRSKGNGSNNSTWVWGDDLLQAAGLVGKPGYSFLNTDRWYCVSAGTGGSGAGANQTGYTAGTTYASTAAMLTINNVTPALLPGSYIAVRVDPSTGNIVGVTNMANASALTRSCWSSFVKTI